MNSKTITRYLIILLGVVFIQSCASDSEEDLYPSTGECDTSNVTYSGTVAPIINDNCISCHGSDFPQGGVILDNYDDLKTYVDNGRFWGAINHDDGFSPMPQNLPQLPQCELDQIRAWIDNGAPNN